MMTSGSARAGSAEEMYVKIPETNVAYAARGNDACHSSGLLEGASHPNGENCFAKVRLQAALGAEWRGLGVGSQGGAEALAIFHQLTADEWLTDGFVCPLARILKLTNPTALG